MATDATAYLASMRDRLAVSRGDEPGVYLVKQGTQDGGHYGIHRLDNVAVRIIVDYLACAIRKSTLLTASYVIGVRERSPELTPGDKSKLHTAEVQ